MRKLLQVEETDRICRLIKGEPDPVKDQEEPEPSDDDEDNYKTLTESQIVERQKRLPKKRKEPSDVHRYMHTLDSCGSSFVYTSEGSGLFPLENTLTPFHKKARK